MSFLNKEQKLHFIIKKSKELGISSYEYGQNTSLSDLGTRNILTSVTKNPRTKNLNIMLEYLENKIVGTEVKEEPGIYNTPEHDIIDHLKHLITKQTKPDFEALKNDINAVYKNIKILNDGYLKIQNDLLKLHSTTKDIKKLNS